MDSNFFNLSKRKKRDLLAELLSGKSTEGIISKKELNAVKRLLEGLSSDNAPVKVNRQTPTTKKFTPAGQKIKKAKTRTTLYLSQEISRNLDKAQAAIRSLVPDNLCSRVSRSFIANQALAISLQEFKSRGKDSRLLHSIVQKS
jgi:hypothetical protein